MILEGLPKAATASSATTEETQKNFILFPLACRAVAWSGLFICVHRPAYAPRASAWQPSLYAPLQAQAGARYRVRTCDPYSVNVVLYH